jgi:hypothetical protein
MGGVAQAAVDGDVDHGSCMAGQASIGRQGQPMRDIFAN